MNMYAVFADEEKTIINGIYDCQQPLNWAPYQDAINSADSRYKAFYDTLLPDLRGGLPAPESAS